MKNTFTLTVTLLFVVSTSIGCITGKDRPRDGGTLEDLPVGPTWPLATRAANRRFILGTGFDNAMKSTLAFGAIAVCKNFDGAGQAAIAIAIPNAPDTFNSQTVGAAGQVFVLVGPVYGTPAPSAPQDRPLGDGIDHALRVYGGTPSDHIGDALACGDLDGDGAEDLLIGAPEAADGRGEVYVFFGRNRATDKDISLAKDRAKVDIILQGARIGDHLGASVAVLRGVVADAPERGTIVMGSPGFDGLAGAAMDRGAVFLHLIPTPRLTPGQTVLVNPDKLKEQRLAAILGGHDGEGLGTTLATGRLSTNAPTKPEDLAATAPNATTEACIACGAVRILRGRHLLPGDTFDFAPESASKPQGLTTIWGSKRGTVFGAALAVGDVADKDGYADLLIGAPRDGGGKVYLFSGSPQLLAPITGPEKSLSVGGNDDQKLTFAGPDDSRFGSAIALVPKTATGSTFDLAIGAPGLIQDGGAVYWLKPLAASGANTTKTVPRGDDLRWTVVAATPRDRLGAFLGGGSINGGAGSGLLIGAPNVPAVYAIFR